MLHGIAVDTPPSIGFLRETQEHARDGLDRRYQFLGSDTPEHEVAWWNVPPSSGILGLRTVPPPRLSEVLVLRICTGGREYTNSVSEKEHTRESPFSPFFLSQGDKGAPESAPVFVRATVTELVSSGVDNRRSGFAVLRLLG